MTSFWAEFFIVLAAEATLLVIVAAVAQRFAPSETWRRTIWQGSFVALAILLICETNGARTAIKGLFVRGETAPRLPAAVSPAPVPDMVPPMTAAPESTGVVPAMPIEQPGAKADDWHRWWPGVVWVGGVVILAGLGIVRRILLLRFRRRCSATADATLLERIDVLGEQLGIRRRVAVVTSGRLVSPIAFGMLRPTICVPANFTELFSRPEQEAVLLHEMAHVAARDSSWLCGADAVLALFWWHPLVWWGQRELRNATEAAADETSALLANGPKILAGCLVTLGSRFTDRAGFKALGIQGVRFRSGLGRRVQRLFNLANTRWAAPDRRRTRAAKFCVPIICVAIVVTGGAWTTTSKGESMKSWKQSLAGLAAVSLLQTLQAEPGAKPNEAVTIAASKAAKPPKDAPASLPTLSDINATSRNRQLMRNRLENIVIDNVVYDSLPLGEVVRQLMDESMRRDPEKRGINFVFAQPRLTPAIDPATGLPGTVSEPIDLKSTTIRIEPPLKNIRLIDLLEIIRRVADRPIEYTIHEYGVVFSVAPGPGTTVFPEPVQPTTARTFKIDPQVFFPAIQKTFGIEIKTRSVEGVRSGLAQFLAALGIDIHGPNRAVFYNEINGILLVRASEEEMLLINAAMQTLGATPQ
jgi:beta-lactamase regulating signal transducer with metallopeptidase domain